MLTSHPHHYTASNQYLLLFCNQYPIIPPLALILHHYSSSFLLYVAHNIAFFSYTVILTQYCHNADLPTLAHLRPPLSISFTPRHCFFVLCAYFNLIATTTLLQCIPFHLFTQLITYLTLVTFLNKLLHNLARFRSSTLLNCRTSCNNHFTSPPLLQIVPLLPFTFIVAYNALISFESH